MPVARFSSTPWKQPHMAAPNNVQLVQKKGPIALAICADGQILPRVVIFKGKLHQSI